jgi:hypothetical protein
MAPEPSLEFQIKGTRFVVSYGGPANVSAGYRVAASETAGTATGYVSYASLTRERAIINNLDFFNPPAWLAELFGQQQWMDEYGTPMSSRSTYIHAPAELGPWMVADYTVRFNRALDELRAGIESKEYRDLWYYEICRAAHVDCWDHLPAEQLIEALARAEREDAERERQERAQREDEAAFRASGGHIVALNRCWECGVTKILGELVDGRLTRMSKDLWREAMDARAAAHRKSLEGAEGVLLSSVGFQPVEDGKFRWQIISQECDDC